MPAVARNSSPGVYGAISGLRYYSPSLGRFVNKDPIEEQGGLNLYGFCGNNGANGYDVLGMRMYWNKQNCPQMTDEEIAYNNVLQSQYDSAHDAGSSLPGFPTSDSLMYSGSRSLGDIGYMGMYIAANGELVAQNPKSPDTNSSPSRFSPGGHSGGFFTDPAGGHNRGGPSEGQTQQGGNGTDTWTMTYHDNGSNGPAWYNDELVPYLGSWSNTVNMYYAGGANNLGPDGVRYVGTTYGASRYGSAYEQAKKYAGGVPAAATLFNFMDNSTGIKLVLTSDPISPQFNPSTNVITWNPNLGYEWFNDGIRQLRSSAVALLHEIDHAMRFAKDPYGQSWDRSSLNWNNWFNPYYNMEEQRVITGSETTIARALGEGIRNNHSQPLLFMSLGPASTDIVHRYP